MKEEKSHVELKLMDLIEKPISNSLIDKIDIKFLSLNLKYIYENIFGLIEYVDDEYNIYHMFFNDYFYFDFIIDNYLNESFKKYNNLFELLNDKLNLNLECNTYNLCCFGNKDDDDEDEYLAHLDRRLLDNEFEIFKDDMNASGYKLYDDESICIGDYDEFDCDLIFVHQNNKVIDYYFYDNIYDNFDFFQLDNFIKLLFKACPDLFNCDYSLIKKIIEYKNNKETKEIIF